MLLIVASILLHSISLSKVLSPLITKFFGLNLLESGLSKNIPSFSLELGVDKTNDISFFLMTLLVAIFLYFINWWHMNKKENSYQMIDILYLVFSILLFFQVNFVRFSGKTIILTSVLVNLVYLILKKTGKLKIIPDLVVLVNGFILGLYGTFFVHQLTTSMLMIFGTIFLSIFIYSILFNAGSNFVSSPWHLLLIFSLFFPWNVNALILLGACTASSLIFIKKNPKMVERNLNLIYSFAILLTVCYNPLFYFGNLDSVEEGFWLGWLQRLLSGQVLYRDVAVYHPPLLAWGLELFVKLFEPSVYYVRLYFHLMKILGLGCILLVYRKLIINPKNLLVAVILLLAFTSGLVKNNVEIRVAIGMMSLYLMFISFDRAKMAYLFLSGMLSVVALGISVETGISVVMASLLGLVLFSKGIKKFFYGGMLWFVGFLATSGIIAWVLMTQGSVMSLAEQVGFYVRAFSGGYFNIPLPKNELQNILLWWRVDRYLSSDVVMWDVTLVSLALLTIYFINKFITKGITNIERFSCTLFVFSLLLTRSALGRSDWYHLLFVLIPLIPLVVHALEMWEIEYNIKHLTLGVWVIFFLIINRQIIQQQFISTQLFKYQSFGNISQRFQVYKTSRSGIALDIDAPVVETDNLIDFIQANTSENDTIFAYPWKPELYFLADRNNATKFDTPYAFFTKDYQEQMIEQIKLYKPKYVIYNSHMNFANLNTDSLKLINQYLMNNYLKVVSFGNEDVLKPR